MKYKCCRLAKMNSDFRKNSEQFDHEREKLQSEYNTMHDIFDKELSETKIKLVEYDESVKFYKSECTRLQKKLKENDETIKRHMNSNTDLNKKVMHLKEKTQKLKQENEIINTNLREVLMSMENNKFDESLQNISPKSQNIIDKSNISSDENNPKFNTLRNIKEYLKTYTSKINSLNLKIKGHCSIIEEQKRENEFLKFRLEEVKKLDAVVMDNLKFDTKIKRIKLKTLIYKSFAFLSVKDMIRVSMVCAAFYSKCTQFLSNIEYWQAIFPNGIENPRNLLWLTFIRHIYSTDKDFIKRITIMGEHNSLSSIRSSKHKDLADQSSENPFSIDTPNKKASINEEEKKTERKEGFFECSYTFFSNAEGAHGPTPAGDTSSLIDYSLMNADNARCDPEEIFWPDFLTLNDYYQKERKSDLSRKYAKDDIEQILTDMQKLFNFNHYRQGMTFVVCFLHIIMKQNRKDIFRMLNILLEEPYYLKKLYSDDFYLLNLIIFQADFLLRQKVPDLYYHFKEQNVLLHDFMVGWIMTLFTCQVFFQSYIKNR